MPAPTATVVPTRLSQVLLAVGARLVAVLRFPEERVVPYDPDEVKLPAPQADALVYYWPDLESKLMFQGAGRVDTRDTVRLTVEVCTRMAVDSKQDSRKWLLDPQYGHLDVRHRVLDALVGFTPVDAQQNWLVDRPIAPAGAAKPKREANPTPGWGRSRLGFELTYILALDTTYQ